MLRWSFVSILLAWSASVPTAQARPGLLPAMTTTEDTRASTIGLQYGALFSDRGSGHTASYLSNFSSTTSKVSAQFGLHFLLFDDAERDRMWGFAGSSMTQFSKPIRPRFDNGVPRLTMQIAPGLVPTVLVGPRHVEIDLPLVLRLSLPASPVPWLTFTPWAEAGVQLHFDGSVTQQALDQGGAAAGGEWSDLEDVPTRFSDVVSYELRMGGLGRGGLKVTAHVGRLDLILHATASTLSTDGTLGWLVHAGGGLRVRWDKVVPHVLPTPHCEPPPDPPPTLPIRANPAPTEPADPPPPE